MTKGKMITALKAIGIRYGIKNNALVKLEHLKSYDVIKLYYANVVKS